MLALAILLGGLVVLLVLAVVLLIMTGYTSLLTLIIPLVPLLMMVGSGLLGLIEVLLLFGGKDDRRLAKRELKWLAGTFLVSAALWAVSSWFLAKGTS
jgi:hypothetical protein